MGARVPKPALEPPRPDGVRSAPLRELAAAALSFLAATVILSYPLAFHPASLSRLDNGDARLNAWALSWVAHQMVQDPLHLFQANTFYPLPNSLAYSEHLAGLGAMALPLLALTDDLVLTNNLILLLAMFASAMGMYWLCRHLTGSHLGSLLAGLFFSFATFRFNRLPHIQMQFYALLPLFLAAWHRYLDRRRRRDLVLAGAFFVLQVLAGTYLGAISAVALALAMATLLPFSRLSRREVGEVLAMLGTVALLLFPFAAPYLWVHRELGVEWDLPGVAALSASPSSYLASSSRLYRSLTEHLWREQPPTDYLFFGFTLLALGLTGCMQMARDRKSRPLLLCYATILCAGVLLSLGPRTPVHPFLYEHLVFFRGLRALTRFGLLPLLSLSVFSAFGLAWLLDDRGGGLRRRKLVAAGIALFFVMESTALPYRLETFRDEPPEVYPWLAQAKPGPILELPFRVIDTQYMFWARHHGFRPTLNGDSGFIPSSHQWMKIAFGRFPSEDSIALLRRLRVRYVILHLGAFRQGALYRMLSGLDAHRHALLPVRDFGRDLVFEVVPDPDASPDPPLSALVRLEARGNDPRLFDRRTDEVVRAEAPELVVDFEPRELSSVAAIRLHYGPAPKLPVHRMELQVEAEGGWQRAWSTPVSWPALAELVRGLLETPRDGSQTLTMDAPVGGSRFRLRLWGLAGDPPELTEIEVLGPPEIPVSTSSGAEEENPSAP